jgi:hypothetical protein
LLSIQARKFATLGTLAELNILIPVAVVLGGGQDIVVDTLAELETLLSIQARKFATIGTLAELETLLSIQARKFATIGTLTESESLIPAQARKVASLGTLAETEALLPIAAEKPIVVSVGTLAEVELLIAIALAAADLLDIVVMALAAPLSRMAVGKQPHRSPSAPLSERLRSSRSHEPHDHPRRICRNCPSALRQSEYSRRARRPDSIDRRNRILNRPADRAIVLECGQLGDVREA